MKNDRESAAARARQDLINAFWLLYEKKPIEKISIKEISELAGYSRSTFYRYFYNVYDLLEQVEEEFANRIAERSDRRMVGNEREDTKMFFASVYDNYNKYISLLMRRDEESGFSSILKKKVLVVMEKNFKFCEDEKINSYILEYKTAGSISTLVKYFKNGKDIPSDEFVDILMKLTESGDWTLNLR